MESIEQKINIEKEENIKPRIKKIAATDRLLPRYFIPSGAKEIEYKNKSGHSLPIVLFNFSTEEKIIIPGALSGVFKHGIRKSRERYGEPQDKQRRYEAIHRIIFSQIMKKLPPEERKRFNQGSWEVRALTEVGEYERFIKPNVLNLDRQISEDQELSDFEISKEEEKKLSSAAAGFSELDWGKILAAGGDAPVLEKRTHDLKAERVDANDNEGGEKSSRSFVPSELQKARYEIGRAARTGKAWSDETVETHLRFEDEIADYWSHRLAVYDLYQRVKSGEIKTMPHKILSVAGGPYGEARAESDLAVLYQEAGLEKPDIAVFDLTHAMLKRGREEYEKRTGKIGQTKLKVTPVQGRMEKPFPFKSEVFDLSECAALDNLQKSEDIYNAINNMAAATKKEGLIRLVHRRKFPQNFYKGLEKMGLKVESEKNSRFHLPDSIFEALKTQIGEEKALVARDKLEKGIYYILLRKAGGGEKAPEIDFNDFMLPTERRQRLDEIEMMSERIRAVAERLRMIEKACDDGNITEAKNLFWEYGKNGRAYAVENGLVSPREVRAATLYGLLLRIGSLRLKQQYNNLKSRVFGNGKNR